MTRPEAPIFPPGRYGRRREPGHGRRWLSVALAVLALGAVLWLTVRLYTQYGANPYQAGPVRYGTVADGQITVSFDVRKPAAGTGICRLQATDASGAETGYAEVTVGTGATVTVTHTLPTRGRAVQVAILGCRAAPR
ncbi:MAG TPA: DUF4307 domain-containing protein [Rugosimonospora sp.]|nr:DUF4307 domain-containing protein [Rugosimonospora sp.]